VWGKGTKRKRGSRGIGSRTQVKGKKNAPGSNNGTAGVRHREKTQELSVIKKKKEKKRKGVEKLKHSTDATIHRSKRKERKKGVGGR